jgi:hypothetical protein
LWVTGHSLGAAVATVAADALPATGGVYTFGSPRVGDGDFAAAFNRRFADRSFRYVDDHDAVTRVPPESFGFPIGSYTPVDAVRTIDSEGHISSAPEPGPFLRDVFGQPIMLLHLIRLLLVGALPSMPDALADHAPVLYVTHIWNDLFDHGE